MSEIIKAKIVVVDDDPTKIADIRATWSDISGAAWSELIEVSSISSARKVLQSVAVDFLILDLKIPRRDNGTPDEREAKDFLEDLHEDSDVRPPREVVLLSAFEELVLAQQTYYEGKGWACLLYGTDLMEWRVKFRAKLLYLRKCVESANVSIGAIYDYDYCILTALKAPELLPFLNLKYGWKSTEMLDSTEFYTGECIANGVKKKIVCGSAFRMGMVHSALLSCKAWHYFRPRFIILAGIAAGVRAETNLGDIMIAEEMWDYGAGKLTDGSSGAIFVPDARQINADHSLVESLWNYGQRLSVGDRIQTSWLAKSPSTRLMVRRGPVASGAAVVANESVLKDILARNRKLIGLEMEGYGMYAACEYLPRPRPRFACIKSVCDFADGQKNDDFQAYAAFTSAEFVRLAIEGGVFESV